MKIDNSLTLQSFENSKVNSVNKLEKLSKNEKLLKEKTDEFEAVMLKMVLDTSLKMENDLFPDEPGEEIYNSMYKDAISNSLSGSFGYSELLFKFLIEQQKGK